MTSIYFHHNVVKRIDIQEQPIDFYTGVFLWGDTELEQLRTLKIRIQQEPNIRKQRKLQAHLRVRTNRYIGIIGAAMSQLRQDPKYFTLSAADRTKVAQWARLYETANITGG